MAKCPVCNHDVATPFFLNVDRLRWLACPHCAARLERKNPRSVVVAGPLLMVLIMLGGRSHRLAVIAEVLMGATFAVILVELMRPQLQLRQPLPKPATRLHLTAPGA